MRRAGAVAALAVVLALGLAGAAWSLTGAGATITAVVGSPFTGMVATVTGSCTKNRHVEISWGDGMSPTAGTARAISGGLTVSGSHTYRRAGTFSGGVVGSVACAGRVQPFTTSFAARVSNAAPPPPRAAIDTSHGAARKPVTTLIASPNDVFRIYLPGRPSFSDGGVAASPDGSLVYVVVSDRNALYEFDSRGGLVRIWRSRWLRGPVGVTTDDDGDVFVASRKLGKVIKFTSAGKFVRKWSVPAPLSIAAAATGPVFVLTGKANWQYTSPYLIGGAHNRVREYSLTGRKLRSFVANLPGSWPIGGPCGGCSKGATPGYRQGGTIANAISVDSSGDPIVTGASDEYLTGSGPCDGSVVPEANAGLCGTNGMPDNPLVSGEVVRFTRGGQVVDWGWVNDYLVSDYPGFYSDGEPTGVAVDPNGGAVYVSDLEQRIDYLRPDLNNPDLGAIDYGLHWALGLVCWVCVNKGDNSVSPAAVAFDCRSNLYVLNPGTGGLDVYVNQSRPPNPSCIPIDTTRPAIAGTAQQGDRLRAHHRRFRKATSYKYRWRRCNPHGDGCTDIAGATDQSYRLTAADVGHRIRVQVSGHNASGTGAPVSSSATAMVIPPAPSSLFAPSISGIPRQGQSLTVDPGSWSGEPTSYSYDWYDCDATGGNCNLSASKSDVSATYPLTEADVGSTMRVAVWALNAYGETGPVSSPPTPVVVPLPPAVISAPSIAGDLTQGQTLTEVHGSWSNNPNGYQIQWDDCSASGGSCGPIAGAAGSSYTLTTADVGHKIEVIESASNPGGSSAPASSAPTAPVASSAPGSASPQRAPKISLAPVISGQSVVDQTLTASTGAWRGIPPLAYAYQWEQCRDGACSAIPGATDQSYTLTPSVQTESLEVVVTATNTSGTSSATSPLVGPVAPPPNPKPVIPLPTGGAPPS